MVKIKNSAGERRQRADELINKYRLLEAQCAALPLHRRRDLSAGSAWETFCAAAIFEGCISTYCREEDGTVDILQALSRCSDCFQHDHFPIAMAWFADLTAFYQRAHNEARSLTTYILSQEQIELAKLEWKYEQASKLVAHLSHRDSTVTPAQMSSRAMECFAATCKTIAHGMPEHAAMKEAEAEMNRYSYDSDDFMATEGVREWFPIDLNMPAWPSADAQPDFTRWQPVGRPTSQPQYVSGSSTSMPRVFDFSNASQSSSTNKGGIWSERTAGLRDSQQHASNSGGWWNKNTNKGSAVNSMPPPQPPAPKVDHRARHAEYDSRWKSLTPYDTQFPYPNSTLSMSGFQTRQTLPYDQQKVALWTPPTIIGVMTKRFFTDAFDVRTTLITDSDNPSNVEYGLQRRNNKDAIVALRKALKLESVKWHPDRLNRRSGVPGQIDQSIGSAPGNVAIRTAVQELIEECDKFVNGANEWKPDEESKN